MKRPAMFLLAALDGAYDRCAIGDVITEQATPAFRRLAITWRMTLFRGSKLPASEAPFSSRSFA